MVALTSDEVSGVPSENFSPGRSLKVQLNPSAEVVLDAAEPGTVLPSRLMSYRFPPIRWNAASAWLANPLSGSSPSIGAAQATVAVAGAGVAHEVAAVVGLDPLPHALSAQRTKRQTAAGTVRADLGVNAQGHGLHHNPPAFGSAG